MKRRYLFGFDAGTSESKGTLIDFEGNVIASASRAHQVIHPQPDWAEADPVNDWLADLRYVFHKVCEDSCIQADEIACIGISTVMAGITLVDEKCDPLSNAILYGIDHRCVPQAQELNDAIGEEEWNRSFGTGCTIEHFGPKILWLKENMPEAFSKAAHITMASGFLTARLTGNYYVDKYSAGCALPMFNPEKRDWDEKFCKYVCSEELLPKVAESTYSVIGEVTENAARETGIAQGTPVICGTTDAGAEAVSVGVIDPGDTMLMYGSTSFYIHVAEKRVKKTSLWGVDYTIDDRFAYTGGMATTGALTKWLRDEVARDLVSEEKAGGKNAYTALFSETEDITAGSGGLIVLPYFQGERMPIQDPEAKGMIFGLELKHTRGHIARACLEGIGYGIDQNLQLIRDSGLQVNEATAVGGGTKNPLWLQVTSDICGIKQKVPEVTIGASYGDALMAGLGIGAIRCPEDIKDIIKIQKEIIPDDGNKKVYEPMKKIYRELYHRNKDLMHLL